MNLDVSETDSRRIEKLIASEESPVGIDANITDATTQVSGLSIICAKMIRTS